MKTTGREAKNWALRLFAGSWTALFVMGAWFLAETRFGRLWWVPLGAGLFFAVGLFIPTAMRRPYRLVEQIFAPVGRLTSVLMLALVFFGVFTPFALLLRLGGWDPLRRRSSCWPASGWIVHPKEKASSDYRWQY